MKKIKQYVVAFLLTLIVTMALTACGKDNNATESTTINSTTEMMTTTHSTTGVSDKAESSTGVIDGAVDSMEKGIDNMMGEGTNATTQMQQ